MTEIAESPLMSPEGRKAKLETYVSNCVAHGWRVESHTDYAASLAKGHRPNHWVHALVSVITLGLWIPVWILRTIFSEKRMAVRVDENGDIQKS